MSTTTRLITADEFLNWPDDGMWHELIKGEVTSMSLPGGFHGEIALEIGRLLGNHVKAHGLGKIYAAETGFLIGRDPDTVRGADVGFVRRERLAAITHREKHIPFAPDLAVEVISPSDSAGNVAEKTAEWLAAGALMVWNVFPRTKTVGVHRPGADAVVLQEEEMLEGGEVVPGFHCRVGDLFA